MTFVFRTSSFLVVFVITIKAATFVVGNASHSENGAADRLNDHVARLIDESVRFRGEAREANDHVEDMALALRVMGERVIERALVFAGRAARSCIASFVRIQSTARAFFAPLVCNPISMPKKEVKHGGYTAVGQHG